MNLKDIFMAAAMANSSSGAVSPEQIDFAMSGATVGQTVKITAVDDNGVPTAWEPADFPSGGGMYETLDEVTLTEQAVPYLDLGATFPNFKKIRVTLIIPTMESSTSLQLYFSNLDASAGAGYGNAYHVGTYSGTGGTYIIEFEPVILTDKEHLVVRTYTLGGSLSFSVSYSAYDHSRILRTRYFFSRQSFPAGSYVKLEGVRV